MATNLVRPLKDTTASGEAYETPLDPVQDGVTSAGFYPQNATSNDQVVGLERDSSGNLILKDGITGTKTLTQISSSTGVTEAAHKTLRQLIHFIDEGPAEGFASGAYLEVLPSGDPFPTSAIWWESAAKLKKIVSEVVTYNSNKTLATSQWKIYDTDGVTALSTITDTYSYSGVFETSRTRTIA